MARSTKKGENRIFVVNKGLNQSLTVQTFADTLESENGGDFNVIETAEQKADAFLQNNPDAAIVDGANSVEDAIEKAKTLL